MRATVTTVAKIMNAQKNSAALRPIGNAALETNRQNPHSPLALTSGIMLFWSYFGNRLLGIKEVDHIAAMQLINHKNALMLDVREQSEYAAGHVLNSKLIPLGKLKERIGVQLHPQHCSIDQLRTACREGLHLHPALLVVERLAARQ